MKVNEKEAAIIFKHEKDIFRYLVDLTYMEKTANEIVSIFEGFEYLLNSDDEMIVRMDNIKQKFFCFFEGAKTNLKTLNETSQYFKTSMIITSEENETNKKAVTSANVTTK
ncbi:hypothetical protein [Lysinibacillus piscis]|uniref:Uncharacterized protein n=1 Tax=Lysinibacillus piscis TaxID=2518931 RepID=A0ABQ5NJV3_9BACI|nr:hypothetical protein [Lysinibacillus sp. KH24]GLC88650.1 hypothetical protein LYSBPC_17770 [Lysinibacillus sp. KH24]